MNATTGFAGTQSVLTGAKTIASRFPFQFALVGTCAFLALQLVIAFAPSAAPFGYAAWVEDDFFYYAEIAQNIAQAGRSTFDGVTLTNGYHPLWMVVCVGLAKLFGIQSLTFFAAIFFLQAMLVVLGVWAMTALLRRPFLRRVVAEASIAPTAALYGVSGVLIAATGMEVALLWPLLPLFCISLIRLIERPTPLRALVATFLASVCILARLDCAIVIAPLALGTAIAVLRQTEWIGVLKLWPAAFGFLPFLGYLAYNTIEYGSPSPISGAAKRLLLEGAPFVLSRQTFDAFVTLHNPGYWIVPVGVTLLSVLAVGVALFARRWRKHAARGGLLLLAAGVAGLYLQQAAGSDWSLWLWYFYPVSFLGALGACAALSVAIRRLHRWDLAWLISPALVAGIVLFAILANSWRLGQPPSESNALFLRAAPVKAFSEQNPGRYAMGDGAGAVAFMLDQPLVQLEGLVNDARMLEEIRAQGSVADSLRRQGVDFYIVGDHLGEQGAGPDGCVDVREPLQAGARSARLSERICEAPVLDVETGWLRTRIWDVRDGLD